MGVCSPGAPTGLRQTQWSVCYKYTHWSAKADIKQLLQCFYQVMHTPVTGTSVSQQAKSQTARHEQISHHSFIPAHPCFSVKVHPQRQLSPASLQGCNCWDPRFCAAGGCRGICYRDQPARTGKPSQTSHMDAGPSSCSARMLTVADMRAESHTFYPGRARGKSYLNCSVSLTDCFHFPSTPTPPGGLKNKYSGLALAG